MQHATRQPPNDTDSAIRLEPSSPIGMSGHVVQFYEDEAFLVEGVAEFLAAGLAAGQSAVVIATAPHAREFLLGLQARGVDTAAALSAGRLNVLDARDVLRTFMVDGLPNAERFFASIGGVLTQCASSSQQQCVRAYGEMVDVLWKEDNIVAAVRLEELWNEIAEQHTFSLLCAYAMDNFSRADHRDSFAAICHQHGHVIPTERYMQADSGARLVEVTMLQQRARALEGEIEYRKTLERALRDALDTQRKAEETVRRREEELKDFLENAAEGMHWVGADGVILWANKAELEMLGYSREEYIGEHISSFHADKDAIRDILTELKANQVLREREAKLICKDGSLRDVLINSNVLFRDGEFVHTRCFTRDITQLKRAMSERERLLVSERNAREEAEEASRAKSQFLAVMSHELRTPLNAIGGHVQLIEMELHGPVTSEQREALSRVERSQRHLLALINDVLNLARIEAGHVEYAITDFEAGPLLAEITSMLEPIFAASELSCTIAPLGTADGAPTMIRADREKVRQILINLVTNAVKFTAPGGVLTLGAGSCTSGAEAAHFEVRDTGIGIPESKLQSIFEPFVQLGARSTGQPQGVGLGLSISRDLARGMKGDLVAESTLGEGSTFTLSLPAAGSR